MSKTKYPPAFGILTAGGWWRYLEPSIDHLPGIATNDTVVQLIPAPEVDRLIAEAVAAERERLQKENERLRDVIQRANEQYKQLQRSKISSGIEPGEGGAK